MGDILIPSSLGVLRPTLTGLFFPIFAELLIRPDSSLVEPTERTFFDFACPPLRQLIGRCGALTGKGAQCFTEQTVVA